MEMAHQRRRRRRSSPAARAAKARRRESIVENATVTLVQGAFGLKVNPFSTVVLSGNVFVPLNGSGLQSDVIFSFGADYSF